MIRPPFQSILIAVALALAPLIGCDKGDQNISAYRAPKDPPIPEAAPAPQAAPAPAPAAQSGPLQWTVPAGWKQQPASEMRFATFAVNDSNPPVVLTVIPLGMQAGDIQSNVNRWEQQIGLPPTPADKLDQVAKKSKSNGLDVTSVDLTAPESANPRQRMLAAIVPHAGRVWFFKLVGPNDVVSAQKNNFDAFMNSLAPGGAAAPTPVGLEAAGVHATTNPITLHDFKAPATWKAVADPQPPRMLAFDIADGKDKAELVVTRFPKSAGNLLDNINRWRGQLGLPPVSEPKSVPMQEVTLHDNAPGVQIEIENPGDASHPARKVLVVLASDGRDAWFLKMTGPTALIDKEKNNFVSFIKSVELAKAQ